MLLPMQEHTQLRFKQLSSRAGTVLPRPLSKRRWNILASNSILILGAPRSGTTWLAKIFDSHPHVLYRHEPDEIAPPDPQFHPSAQIALWLSQRSLRAAGKRPHFVKAWRPSAAHTARRTLAAAMSGAQRLVPNGTGLPWATLPDLLPPRAWMDLRGVIKLVNWNGSAAARAMPGLNCVVILRHPCGQVGSVLAGQASRQFRDADAATLRAAEKRAAQSGISSTEFAALPDASRLAYAWLAFNEGLVRELRGAPNARVVLYEDLCRDPKRVVHDLFGFTNLSWDPQTEAFLQVSTQDDRSSGYFDVFRASAATAERWRERMSLADQNAIRDVVKDSHLARFWPDLVPQH